MKIGVPKEIKKQENRVGITPAGVHELTVRGHQVFIEAGAGVGSGISDADYLAAGATIAATAAQVWGEGDLLVKVKEPVTAEYSLLREDQVLFTYLHLAADKPQTDALLESGVTAIAYETVQLDNYALPLLSPMSEVAGRLSALVGTATLFKHNGGNGVLVSGVSGVSPAKVAIIGAGIAGANAAQIAVGLRADVTILDVNLARLAQLDAEFGGRLKTIASNSYNIEKAVTESDIIIGSVLIPGARAPKLVTNALVAKAKPGSVFVDIAVDQGGCFEDTHPTTHAEPTYPVHNSVFYAVANMPGAVPVTSTYALTNATLPYVVQLADMGWVVALKANTPLARGLSTYRGQLTSAPVAQAWGYDSIAIADVLGN
jgi:alanine dehydrogenase